MSRLIEDARREMKLAGWMEDDTDAMQKAVVEDILQLLETFGNQNHSGFSAQYVLSYFERLARFRPITPLTGEEDEWDDDQNMRCSEVFRREGRTYRINARIFRNESGDTYTSSESHEDISFPWSWTEAEVIDVEDEIDRERKGKPA